MRRADTQVEHALVELVDGGAPVALESRAERNLARTAGLIDQSKALGIVQAADMERSSPTPHHQAVEVDDEPRLVYLVLELADRTPRADAPAVGRLGEVTAGERAR